MATTFAQFSGSGSGTESDPYLILNPIQLNQLRNFLGQDGVYFKLMANIDLTEFIEDEYPNVGWLPVGTSSSWFRGVLDGNGYTISGLTINRGNMDYVGLFGYADEATIKNLKVIANVKGQNYVGGIAGALDQGNITNCAIEGNVKGESKVGGFVGYAFLGKITDCITTADVTGTSNCVGGVSGQDGVFNNCVSSNITVSGCDYVGGIAGTGEANHCGFYGVVNGNSRVGGIVGSGDATTSHASGKVYATGDNVGGIVGHTGTQGGSLVFRGKVTDCYYSGIIHGNNQVGGIAGSTYGQCPILRNYVYASISGNKQIGGICGYAEGTSSEYSTTIKKNVSNIICIMATEGDVGRIYGVKKKVVYIGAPGSTDENKSYNKTVILVGGVAQDVTDSNEQNGTGVSRTTLKLKATYVAMGWDFNEMWDIQETECYPYHKWQTAPPVITSQVVSGATTINGKCVDGGTIYLQIEGQPTLQQNIVGNDWTFTVNPLQAGKEVYLYTKAPDKEQSYFVTETVSYLGSGTVDDPYQVYTADDLTSIYRKGYFKLMNDIDLTSWISANSPTEGWLPLGRNGSEMTEFDGNNHKIKGFWTNTSYEFTGLFSLIGNATIKNLTIEVATGKQVKGGYYTGVIVGKLINGTIKNCKVHGTVIGTTVTGGIIGLLDGGTINDCQANVTMTTSTENASLGGIAGELNGTLERCMTKGALTGSGVGVNIAGVVGTSKVGSTISDSYSTAVINSSYCAAGAVAYNYGIVERCYASGDLSSMNYAAGVVGYNDGSGAIIRNCAAMSPKLEVTYESQQSAQGGGYGQRIIGGLKNGAPAPEMNNYALKTMKLSVNGVAQIVYDDIMNGVAKTGTELMQQATYEELGWNFSSMWNIDEGNSYPYFDVADGGADPDVDPVVEPTTDDQLSVATVQMKAGGKTQVSILLNNQTLNYTAYQFDLTLPTGFSIGKKSNGKYDVTKGDRYEDESQQLSVELLDAATNTYRFISFSMSNGIIEGTEGAILNMILEADANVTDGEYTAKLKNINFTSTNGTSSLFAEAEFKLKVSSIIAGDANGDGTVNVTDIVETVKYILNNPSTSFNFAAADVNGDGQVNVTDIVCMVSIIMSSGSNARAFDMEDTTGSDWLTLDSEDGGRTLSLCLANENSYVASQFDIHLSEGQQICDIQLNSSRMNGHVMTWSMTDEKTCRVIIYSMANSNYKGNDGELLKIILTGNNGDVVVDNITFITPYMGSRQFDALYIEKTGIMMTIDNEQQANGVFYDLQGRRVETPTKGIYIKNGKKYVVK